MKESIFEDFGYETPQRSPSLITAQVQFSWAGLVAHHIAFLPSAALVVRCALAGTWKLHHLRAEPHRPLGLWRCLSQQRARGHEFRSLEPMEKAKCGGVYLSPQYWEGGHKQVSGACWPASLVK